MIELSLEKEAYILGEIHLDFQDTFLFDNYFYFTLDFRSKIKVLSIGEKAEYFSKIFSKDEFDFTTNPPSNVDLNNLPNQQLIILNELTEISSSLKIAIQKFVFNGGSILIIPNANLNLDSYNSFFKDFKVGGIQNTITDSLLVTSIAFDHPIYSDVFLKKIKNFEYPTVNQRFTSNFNGSSILSFSNNESFLQEIKSNNASLYWFSGSLNINNSNFSRSPLIVPTLYNIAYQSSSIPKPYYISGESFDVKVSSKLNQDEILKVAKKTEFIPLQKIKFNHVILSLSDQIKENGFYLILRDNDTLQQIAINYSSLESNHNYLDINQLAKENKNITVIDSVNNLFRQIKEKNSELSLWKLFLALAIVSLFFEILILKFFKA